MSVKYHSQAKTLGPRAAQLFTELNELRRSTFTLTDVGLITGPGQGGGACIVDKYPKIAA